LPVFSFQQYTKTVQNIANDRTFYQMSTKYARCRQFRPNHHKIYQHLPLLDPPKFTQFGILVWKICHLATLITGSPDFATPTHRASALQTTAAKTRSAHPSSCVKVLKLCQVKKIQSRFDFSDICFREKFIFRGFSNSSWKFFGEVFSLGDKQGALHMINLGLKHAN
jgi:hypothetical protein